MSGDTPEQPSPLRRGGHPRLRHPANLAVLRDRRATAASRWGTCEWCETLAEAPVADPSRWAHVYATVSCSADASGAALVPFDQVDQDWFLLTPVELMREVELAAEMV
jgi:hypothetical protein